jgi:S-adenosylmethionine synthetase
MMFGYATNETKSLMPAPIVYSHELLKMFARLRKTDKKYAWLRPDSKSQLSVVYEDGRPVAIDTVVISHQTTKEGATKAHYDEIRRLAEEYLAKTKLLTPKTKFFINPTGKFLIGGFEGDAGLTGRKIVVDAYQGFANVGGGCQNGKDATKVDFSASHMARKIACEYLKSHKLEWCEVQLSYAIGMAEPLAIYINSSIGYVEPEQSLYQRCTPANIVKELNLLEVDYEKLAMFGHYTKADS